MRYKLKKGTDVLMVAGKKFKTTSPNIYFRAGESVEGSEYYVVAGKGMKRMVKVATNRYIPFENVEAVSGIVTHRREQKGMQPVIDRNSGIITSPSEPYFYEEERRMGGILPSNLAVSEMMIAQSRKSSANGDRISGAKYGDQAIHNFWHKDDWDWFSGKHSNVAGWMSAEGSPLPVTSVAISEFFKQGGYAFQADNTGEVYSGFMDWLFGKKDKKEGTTDVVELTPDQAKEQHKASGSKKPFGEWIQGEGKDWLVDFGNQLAGLLDKGGVKDKPSGKPSSGGGSKPTPPKSTTILGMHPVTFAVVSLVGIGTIGYFAFGRKPKAKAA